MRGDAKGCPHRTLVAEWIMGVTDASLDGYLSANLASVAGGVGTGGRDRGKRLLRNRYDAGGTGHICWVVTRQICSQCPRH